MAQLTKDRLHEHSCSEARGAPKPGAAFRSSSKVSTAPSEGFDDAERTTLIIRQVPKDVSRDQVTSALKQQGFGKDFDFLYCPLDYATQKGFGYLLVNFSSHSSAERFRKQFHGQCGDWLAPRASTLELVWAKGEGRQGLAANLERYRNSPVMHTIVPDEFKPISMHRGRRVSFPRPTERLQAPAKLPRAVWRAWTDHKKGGTCAPAAYYDRSLGCTVQLPAGWRPPPGLETPTHIMLQ